MRTLRYQFGTLLIGSAFALCVQPLNAQQSDAVASAQAQEPVPKKIAKILAKGDGRTRETAYKVRSVQQEYQVLATLGLKPIRQSLVIEKKAYDVMTVQDPATGEEFDLWFEVPF